MRRKVVKIFSQVPVDPEPLQFFPVLYSSLKIKIASCFTSKMGSLRVAGDCSLGQACYGKTIGQSREQRGGSCFY